MAIKQFAIPLDNNSQKSGEANFKQIADSGTFADFEITHVIPGVAQNELNLITSKNGVTKDHIFAPTFGAGSAKVNLSSSELSSIYGDAAGGDWDYVEAKWTVGQSDTPSKSNLYIHQSGRTYNYYGW